MSEETIFEIDEHGKIHPCDPFNPSPPKTAEVCLVEGGSSRICELGTKGCIIQRSEWPETAEGEWTISTDRMSAFQGNTFLFTGREATGIVEVLQTVDAHNAALADLRAINAAAHDQLAVAYETQEKLRREVEELRVENRRYVNGALWRSLQSLQQRLATAEAALKIIKNDDYPEEFVARASEDESARMFARNYFAALAPTPTKEGE